MQDDDPPNALERRRPRRQVSKYPGRLAGPPQKSVGDGLLLGERTNPTLRNERSASCEAGSGIYRRLGAVLILSV